MLSQMPIWWALWRVLNGAIELRHAPWIGWIHDLSAKDPYYILPVVMAITMYLIDENDAADDDRSVAAEDDDVHAADDGGFIFFNLVERAESVYVHEQLDWRGAAVLFEPHAAAAVAKQIQEEKRMSEGRGRIRTGNGLR